MSFHPSTSRDSTTEPNTPQPLDVDDNDESNPSGDFARIVPTSRAARIAFHDLVKAMKEFPEKYTWHQRFIHVSGTMDELESEFDELSTSDEIASPPKLDEPILLHKGFWRLNMDLHPASRQLGWVLGKGRWNDLDTYSKLVTAGGVDILLTANPKESLLHGRHARFLHSLESNTLMVIADKKLRVGEVHLRATEITTFGKKKTAIAFGKLEYDVSFTDLDQSIYRAQLAKLSHILNYTGLKPGSFMNPTPAETDYMIMNKYFIKSSFTQGSTCWVCSAVNKDTGASVAVKKIAAITTSILSHARREILAMKKLQSDQRPLSVAKLVDSIIIEPSKSSGATECYIISQPLINYTLGQLLLSDSLPVSSRVILFEQMLEGLSYLHAQGCMHRDLKPENILASSSPPRAVIIDFGCATWNKTSRDHMKGTIRYLAPEIIALKEQTASRNSAGNYDMSVDIWSMGLTAYELMRGLRVGFTRISDKVYDNDLIPAIQYKPGVIADVTENWPFRLIRDMLAWEPKERIKAEAAYQRCLGYSKKHDEQDLPPKKRAREDKQTDFKC